MACKSVLLNVKRSRRTQTSHKIRGSDCKASVDLKSSERYNQFPSLICSTVSIGAYVTGCGGCRAPLSEEVCGQGRFYIFSSNSHRSTRSPSQVEPSSLYTAPCRPHRCGSHLFLSVTHTYSETYIESSEWNKHRKPQSLGVRSPLKPRCSVGSCGKRRPCERLAQK